jgi:hypothetical protein
MYKTCKIALIRCMLDDWLHSDAYLFLDDVYTMKLTIKLVSSSL